MEYGIVRRIPMSRHLAVDALAGFTLAVSPWVFDFVDTLWLPHLALGVTELAAAFVTKTVPGDRRSAR